MTRARLKNKLRLGDELPGPVNGEHPVLPRLRRSEADRREDRNRRVREANAVERASRKRV